MNTWEEVASLVITIERLHSWDLSDRSITNINNIWILINQNGIDSPIEDFEASKELKNADAEVPHIESFFSHIEYFFPNIESFFRSVVKWYNQMKDTLSLGYSWYFDIDI